MSGIDSVLEKVLIGVGTSVVLAVVFYLHKHYSKPLFAFVRSLPGLVDDVATIKAEVLSNGGASLKDKVVKIGDKLATVDARQRGLISTLSRPTFATDKDFNWTEGNMAVERLTGYSFAQLERRQWKSRIHESDRARVMDEIAYAVKDKRAATVSFCFVNPDGVEIPVRLEASPTFSPTRSGDDGPVVVCWFGSLERTGPMEEDNRTHDERRHETRRMSS